MLLSYPRSVFVRLLTIAGGLMLTLGVASQGHSQVVYSNDSSSPAYVSSPEVGNGLQSIGTGSQSIFTGSQSIVTGSQSIGTRVCPKCGRIHGSSRQPIQQTSAYGSNAVSGYGSPSARSSANLRSTGGTSNVLAALNSQRARQGVGSLQYDPALQAVATRRAQLMASTGNKSHPSGSFSPGTYEGVGWSSSYSPSGVSACFTSDPNMRVAGAAMATGSDGVYFCVVYR